MKQIKFYVILLLAILLFACNDKEVLLTDFFQAKKEINNDSVKFKVDIRMELPVKASNPALMDSIKGAILYPLLNVDDIRKSPDKLFADYIDTVYQVYHLDLQELSALSSADGLFAYEETIEGLVTLLTDSMMCYNTQQYVYSGGAHGMQTNTYRIFDLLTGKELQEGDIFLPDFELLLTDIMVGILQEDAISKQKGDYILEDVYPNGNLTIEPDCIVYTFNPYDIAPYSYGSTAIRIPFVLIKHLMNPNTVVYQYLASNTMP